MVISRTPRWNNAWFIVSEPIGSNRQWWVDKLKPMELVLLAKHSDACCLQAALDDDRDQHRTRATDLDWWDNYTPRAGDTIL